MTTAGVETPIGRRILLLLLLGAWVLLLLVTHMGPRSPYTYLTVLFEPKVDATRYFHPDAPTVYPVTRFFYDGTKPSDWETAHNIHLPFHSFATAIALSFVRDYPIANYVINVLFLMLLAWAAIRLGMRHGMGQRALLLTLMIVFALPAVLPYLAQPMHYVVGPATNMLLMLAVIALTDDELRRPVLAGAIVAILSLSYHWYVYAAAVLIVLALHRFRTRRDDLIFATVAFVPMAAWNAIVDWLSRGSKSMVIREFYLQTIIVEWAEFFQAPIRRALFPYLATHIGMHIGLHHILALIYWPLLAYVVIGLWKARPTPSRATLLCTLLLGFFFLEQIVTAAFDWENNPRRALPLVFVFACAFCWLMERDSRKRLAGAVHYALLAIVVALAFADVVLSKPGAAFIYTSHGIHTPAKDAMRYVHTAPMVTVHPQQTVLKESLPPARVRSALPFLVTQLFVGTWLVALFWILARANLLPRLAPLAVAAIWLLSAVRFL